MMLQDCRTALVRCDDEKNVERGAAGMRPSTRVRPTCSPFSRSDGVRLHSCGSQTARRGKPEIYRARGVELTPLVIEVLRHNGLDSGGRVILQSFDETTLRALAFLMPSVPRVFLMERAIAERWLDEMRYFLFDLGVDALFTENPDQFPAK